MLNIQIVDTDKRTGQIIHTLNFVAKSDRESFKILEGHNMKKLALAYAKIKNDQFTIGKIIMHAKSVHPKGSCNNGATPKKLYSELIELNDISTKVSINTSKN